MPYKNKTPFFNIPYMGNGDMLTEEQERIQMNTIDSLFQASLLGCTQSFFREGTFALEWNQGGTECHLTITPSSSDGFSLMGIINGYLFRSTSKITVSTTLYADSTYYVYVEYLEGLETDAQNFAINAYTEEQTENSEKMALCVVDTSDGGTIDTNVAGKVYASSILSHIAGKTNPHGTSVSQDTLNVTTSLSVKGNAVKGTIYTSAFTAGNGSSVSVSVGNATPVFATVYPASLTAGDIAWTISGSSVLISNTGSSGIALNIKVDIA